MFYPLPLPRLLILVLLLTGGAHIIAAQNASALPKRLPSADKIVDNYLKAIGGKKKAAAIKEATAAMADRDTLKVEVEKLRKQLEAKPKPAGAPEA